MVHRVILPLLSLTSHVRVPVGMKATLLSISFLYVLEEADDSLNAWVSDSHVGDLDGVPGSWSNPEYFVNLDSKLVDGRF